MAIGCDQCPQTFRTQSGKAWHLQHRHADLPIQESSDQVKTSELEAIVENEITAQIGDLNSPFNVALDERVAGVLTQVKVMIGDSDRFLREHIEHRIDERLQGVTTIRREPAKVEDQSDPLAPYLRDAKPARAVKVAKMNADTRCPFSASGKRCDHLKPFSQHATLRAIGVS